MADDLHYVGGDNYLIDDLTGFKVRSSKAKRTWQGFYVRPESWEPRQSQDFVRGVRDDQTVAVARPRSTNVFTTLTTSVAVTAASQATSLQLQSAAGMNANDTLGILLDNQSVFTTTIVGAPSGNTVALAQKLPGSASAGNQVTDYSYIPAYQEPQNFPPSDGS